MNTPLFNQYNTNPMIQNFNEFRSKLTGNPQAQVQNLLNSGRVSQAQYNAAVQKANMLRGIFGV